MGESVVVPNSYEVLGMVPTGFDSVERMVFPLFTRGITCDS